MEGLQDVEDVLGTNVIDLKRQLHEFLKEALIHFPTNVDHDLIFLHLPVGEVLHQLFCNSLHVEATGADGDPRKGEAGHRPGGVLQAGCDQVLLPVVVGGHGPVGSQSEGGQCEKSPEESVEQGQGLGEDIADSMNGGRLRVFSQGFAHSS